MKSTSTYCTWARSTAGSSGQTSATWTRTYSTRSIRSALDGKSHVIQLPTVFRDSGTTPGREKGTGSARMPADCPAQGADLQPDQLVTSKTTGQKQINTQASRWSP